MGKCIFLASGTRCSYGSRGSRYGLVVFADIRRAESSCRFIELCTIMNEKAWPPIWPLDSMAGGLNTIVENYWLVPSRSFSSVFLTV